VVKRQPASKQIKDQLDVKMAFQIDEKWVKIILASPTFQGLTHGMVMQQQVKLLCLAGS
jgi:hypothetical protein